ncbi:MAG: hypothetical protein U9O56_07395 [Campylobacterota bacterium]|nr:hypothetical protein [Campylobacterota bacterium]
MRLKILILITLLFSVLNAQENSNNIEKNLYIINHDDLIDQRAQDKMNQIVSEAKKKLNINLYIDIKENNGIDTELPREKRIALVKQKEKLLVKDLKKPYAVLTMAIDQMYINILTTPDLKDIIDKDDILDGYVIPLLASKDKNSLFAKTSAATLNGIAQIADSVALSRGIKLESSIGSEGKTAGTIWRVFMYTLVIAGIFLYTLIVLREKKYKKLGQENEQKRK